MATRRRLAQNDDTRQRIQTSQLINRLHGHVFDGVELSSTQLKAVEILLRKTLPDLTAAENKTEVLHRYVARLPEKLKSTEEWQKQHAQPTIQ